MALILLVGVYEVSTHKYILDNIAINPAGTELQPKTRADADSVSTPSITVNNNNAPYWGKVNYGELDAMKSNVTDANGTRGVTNGDAPPIYDMKENSTATSHIPPAPDGITINQLPGAQPNGSIQNSLAFSLQPGKSLMAPRNYYASTINLPTTNYNGQVLSSSSKELDPDKSEPINYSVSIFQVPYGDQFFISDTTGTSNTPDSAIQTGKTISQFLDKLKSSADNNSSGSAQQNLLFKNIDTGEYSDDMTSLNNLINIGLYSEDYKTGLTLALGDPQSKTDIAVPMGAIPISNNGGVESIYQEFDYIYNYMVSASGQDKYSPQLVSWAKNNADSIVQVLMANYMLQSQFATGNVDYRTPFYYNNWNENSIVFHNDLQRKGESTKEPFFLYCSFDGKGLNSTYPKQKVTPPIDTKYIAPDLSYIFQLYSAVMFEVWKGADVTTNINLGLVNFDYTYCYAQWKNMVDQYSDSLTPIDGTNIPSDANKIYSNYDFLSKVALATGLSSTKYGQAGTENVYGGAKNIIAALRILFSKGEAQPYNSSNQFIVGGRSFPITPIQNSKYNNIAGISNSTMYNVFKNTEGSTYVKYATMLQVSSKVPESPAVFVSRWGGSDKYVMLPALLGGTKFPAAVKTMLNGLAKGKGGSQAMYTLSYANRYIMAFNLSADIAAETSNDIGLREVFSGSHIGTATNTNEPIFLTGYNGGEYFNLVDYFKAQRSVELGNSSTGLTTRDVTGEQRSLGYLNLTKDFFSLNSVNDFIGAGGSGKVSIDSTLKENYKKAYTRKNSDPVIQAISPNYNTFFETQATVWP